MNRQIRVNVNVLVALYRVLNNVTRHSPRQISIRAKKFLIYEVAPSADHLSKHKINNNMIKYFQSTDLLTAAEKINSNNSEYNPAVYRKSSVPYLIYFREILAVLLPIHNNIKQSCPYYAYRCCNKHHINHMIAVDSVFSAVFQYTDNYNQKCQCSNNTIPINGKRTY